MKRFNIKHDGCWRDINRHELPAVPGIYVVYKCDYNSWNDIVDVKEILYIGESDNIHERHNSAEPHEHYDEFVRSAGGKEHICYGVIPLAGYSEDDRKTIEAAMIHIQKPPINTDNKDHYTKPASDITMTGGPDCWSMKRFIHPFEKGDEIGPSTLANYLRNNMKS